MTTISTFLPIVHIGIRAKPVKPKAVNPEIKLLKVSVLFLQPIPYYVIYSLQSSILVTWDVWPLVPFLVRCVVSTAYAHCIFVELDRFSKIFFFIRFWTMEKKRSQRRRKSSSTVGLFIILDNVSSSRSWPSENWRLVFSAQSEQVSTNVPFF